ncbi:MAG TPA: nuclear transport factor 2 family protein [Terracidiphilus sp.]|nr:nuclear transport factor 2 family protein [Terracidiphilus sp.]
MFRLRTYCCAVALCFVAVGPVVGQTANAASAAGATSAEITEFQGLEDSWSNAINQRDQFGLELALSPQLVNISASGDVTTRDQQVANMLSSDDKTLHVRQRVVAVRMLGDVALVNGTYLLHHRVDSSEVDEKGVFTHVFQRDHGRWKCISSQRTLLREDADGKDKGRKRSSSNSPFHIPFFSSDKKN